MKISLIGPITQPNTGLLAVKSVSEVTVCNNLDYILIVLGICLTYEYQETMNPTNSEK